MVMRQLLHAYATIKQEIKSSKASGVISETSNEISQYMLKKNQKLSGPMQGES